MASVGATLAKDTSTPESGAKRALKRAIGIVRVSRTAGREGEKFHSPEIQRERIEIDCERWGLKLIDIVEELDISGGKPLRQRPGLSEALRWVDEGMAEAIVFAYRDRVDRSIDTASELCRRMDKAGALLLAGGQRITHSTHDGWRHATLESFLNEDQRRAVAAKMRDVHVGNIKAGVVPYPIPIGYRRRENGTAEIDPVTGPMIRNAFGLRAAGLSTTEICRWLAEQEPPIKLSVGGLLRVLERRFYLGELHFGSYEPNLTAHEPLVSLELFEAANARKGKLRGRRALNPSLLARLGVLRCRGCGCRMAVSTKSSGRPPFYRCNTVGCAAPVAIMASEIEPRVVKATLELCEGLVGSATRESGVLAAKERAERADAALQRGLDVLADILLSPDDTVALEPLRKLREEATEARRLYAEALETDASARLAITAKDVFERGTLEEKRELISAVIDTVWVKRGRTKAERAERVEIVGRTL